MAKKLANCPEPELLARFLAGDLHPDELEDVAVHLDECPACQRRIETAPEQATWADDIRWAGKQGPPPVDIGLPLARLNELLTDYEVVSEVGRGGMGIVYKARQRKLNRIVALKVLPALLGAVRPEAMARFRREAELAAKLTHSNIIGVHDFGEVDGTLYFAMQLVEGQTLRDVLREIEATHSVDAVVGAAGSPSGSQATTKIGSSAQSNRAYFRRVAQWMTEAAEALQYAHEHGVVHRDIKPSNLLLNTSGHILISDFGLARASQRETFTATRAILGTARYMSPEQVDSSRGAVDARTDVYGLGATMYELLTFKSLFAGTDDREIMQNVLHKEPPPPHRIVSHVPHELETICLKAIEKLPKERYATAQEMADDLRRWSLGMPILARRPTVAVRVGKWARRRQLPVALGAGCIVLGVALAGAYAAYRVSNREASVAREDATTREVRLLGVDARTAYDRGDVATALATIEQGLRIDPHAADLLSLKAKTLVLQNDDNAALGTIDLLLAAHPDDWRGHYTAARIFADWGPTADMAVYDSAANKLGLTADERRKKFAQHRDAVARLHPDSAELDCLLAADETDPQKAIKILDRALERFPALAEALAARVSRDEQLGDYETMLVDAERLASVRPRWGLVHWFRGRALERVGRPDDAERAYSEAIDRSPTEPTNWYARSLVKTRRGRYAEALADARRVIELDENFPYVFVARARAYAGLGQLDNALADLSKAMSLRPNDIEVYHERAKLNYDTGRFDAAVADMTRAIELKPNDARAYSNRAVALVALKRLDRAIDDLKTCVQLNPNYAIGYRNLGEVQMKAGRIDDALASYSKAIELQPGVPGDLTSRAALYLHKGEYASAIADLTRLIDTGDSSDDVRLHRGMAYELAGAPRLALADYGVVAKTDGPAGRYARLWSYLLLREQNDEAAAASMLGGPGSSAAPAGWIGKLYELFRGTLTPAALLDAAATHSEICEAYYYIGMHALQAGEIADARKAFTDCLAIKQAGVLERQFARARLAQLDGKNAIESSENQQPDK